MINGDVLKGGAGGPPSGILWIVQSRGMVGALKVSPFDRIAIPLKAYNNSRREKGADALT